MSAPSLARTQDPIVAIATAPGRGAVGIVRVSSPQPLQALAEVLCGRALQARHAHHGPWRGADGGAIDHGLSLWFPAPHSYTGEHVLELQAHGGPLVLQLLLARVLDVLPGSRMAEPGEFTQRAYLNGKLDLAQAEAVADLIDASTEAAARSAARALGGALSAPVDALRDALVQLRMLVEATLDFPEEDIEFIEAAHVADKLAALTAQLDALLLRTRQGALLREGVHVVLAGQPNVGKSSLLNALAGAELAIVTPVAGTTRDRIRQTIQIHGVPLHITDTAGLHDSRDEVEQIGIARSWESIADADVLLWLHDLTRSGQPDYEAAEAAIAQRLPAGSTSRLLHVHNKADAPDAALAPGGEAHLALSARTGAGLESLREALLARAGWESVPEGLFTARERHVQALRATRHHLAQAAAQLAADAPALDLLAHELRVAHDHLGAITGAFSPDDLLGVIFSQFCIGK